MEAGHFAGRLAELRAGAGLTQQQLADRAGLHRVEVAKLERGDRSPSWETVLALSSALGVSCEAFRQPPADAPRKGPGRPPRARPAEPAEEPAPEPTPRKRRKKGG